MPYYADQEPTDAIKPVLDQNAASPPIPAELTQKTPEFLERLVQELDETRNRRSVIFAERYSCAPEGAPGFGQKGYQSRVMRNVQLDKEDRALQEKEDALQRQLQDMRSTVLMAPVEEHSADLEKVPATAQTSKGFNRNGKAN